MSSQHLFLFLSQDVSGELQECGEMPLRCGAGLLQASEVWLTRGWAGGCPLLFSSRRNLQVTPWGVPFLLGQCCPWLGWKQNPNQFYSCRWMQCPLKASLIIHVWVYLSSELPSHSLLFSLCSSEKPYLAQIYTGTDIKALTHEAQCNRLFLL